MDMGWVATVVNKTVVSDSTVQQAGFDIPCSTWSLLNQFRTDTWMYCSQCIQWNLAPLDKC